MSAALAACLLAALSLALVFSPPRASATGGAKTFSITVEPPSLDSLEKAAKAARTQMHTLEVQLGSITVKFAESVAQEQRLSAQLSDVRMQLGVAQTKLDTQSAIVGDRLVAVYKAGGYSWVDAFTSSGALSDWQDRTTYLQLISAQDQQTVDGLAQIARNIKTLTSFMDTQRQQAITIQASIDQQRLVLADKIAQRRAVLDGLVKQIKKILIAQRYDPNVPIRGKYTPVTWAAALLRQLQMPVTQDNVAALTAWEMAEGGHWNNTAHYNPLNTTQPEPGATSMNSVGVKAYVSWAQGFLATIVTLHNGRYDAILAALAAGNDASAVAQAVAASPWGTGNFSSLF
jgi:peptidoglycan hydrolase CwlO-like protein